MNELTRHHEIIEWVNTQKMVKITDIISRFEISPATARRDITKLDKQGAVKKVRNGIMRINELKNRWMPLENSETDQFEEKTRIAMQAAKLCGDEDSIIVNCGSTAFLLGRELCGKNISIITNYFPLACYLIENDHENLIIMGGQYNKSQNIILAPVSELTSLFASKWMFTSGKTLTPQGLYKSEILTAVSEQQILPQIEKLVVVVDSTKISAKVESGMLFCSTSKIDILITGKNANSDVIEQIKQQGVDVILV